MSEASVVFTLDGVNLTIKCTTEDKIKEICEKYSTQITKNMNSLLFLYEGNKVNFDLSFKEQANEIDRNNHEMKILVNKNENNTNINNNITVSNTKNTECLLDNAKSTFFSRILFSYLDEKIKLKVIKYNKKLKNEIDIKLINYKFYSGKYIIYETNIKGKEYDGYDNLLFEGEYLNGERNGKGKEYDFEIKSKLKFEGEYLKGKRNGKGKEYFWNGKLKFEGEYLNGERLNGKLYNYYDCNLYIDLKSANGSIEEYNFNGK